MSPVGIIDQQQPNGSIEMTNQPTQAQIGALYIAAQRNGRRWKSAVLHAWETGNYSSCYADDLSDKLQQVRNEFGPSWLMRFRFPTN